MMNRRGFIKGLAAALAAPAVVRAESLMKIVVPKKDIVLLDDYVQGMIGDGTAEMFTDVGEGWHHYAITSQAGKVTMYRDGVECSPELFKKGWVNIKANVPDKWQHGIHFGMNDDGGVDWGAKVDELRVTTGVALYLNEGAGSKWREAFLRL